jgi:N-acetyltransferase
MSQCLVFTHFLCTLQLATLLQTINFSLSAPDLPQSVLSQSKAYLFLIPAQNSNHSTTREKIVGCLIAQHIETAMKIVAPHATSKECTTESFVRVSDPTDSQGGGEGGLYCDPTPFPTPLGIPRIFVSAQYRHRGIAHALLDAAACTFIHGCTLDPSRGQVAFSQPTGAGRGLMEKWGRGGVRIFEE